MDAALASDGVVDVAVVVVVVEVAVVIPGVVVVTQGVDVGLPVSVPG